MMGVGKSTVGKKLARKLKLKFVDIDRLIEKKRKAKLVKFFYKMEKVTLEKLKDITLEKLKKRYLVVALGGGAFVNEFIREKLLRSSCY